MTGIVKNVDLIDFEDLEDLIKNTYDRSLDIVNVLDARNESVRNLEVPDTNDRDDETYMLDQLSRDGFSGTASDYVKVWASTGDTPVIDVHRHLLFDAVLYDLSAKGLIPPGRYLIRVSY